MLITGKMVKDLQEFSGESVMSCRAALHACEGNLLYAAGWLATEGQAVVRHNDTPRKRMDRAINHANRCYEYYDGKLFRRPSCR